eukprot:g5736.t1
MVVLVGDMATWHASSDAPLCMNIKSNTTSASKQIIGVTDLAETVSGSVTILSSIETLENDVLKAYTEAMSYPTEPLQSRISTLIVPHDLSWQKTSREEGMKDEVVASVSHGLTSGAMEFVESCIERIRSTKEGKVAFLVAGHASLDDASAISNLGRVAAKVKAALYCENSFARIDRGFGRPHVQRLPYFPQDAVRELQQYSLIVTFDCRLPVAQFGYQNGPSEILALPEDAVWQLDSGDLTPELINELHKRLDGDSIIPGANCGSMFALSKRPELPKEGNLSPVTLCTVIAHFQPESAIIVDESITSGGQYWNLSKGCPAFTHLTLTGGAIGCGPALAIGAALASPDRQVINIQADGSAMYCIQALWTQAKERLNIITVICSNRTYAILKIEVGKQGIRGLQGKELGNLTDISQPEIDWVKLAEGIGVQAVRVATVQEFSTQFSLAITLTGPILIEAML